MGYQRRVHGLEKFPYIILFVFIAWADCTRMNLDNFWKKQNFSRMYMRTSVILICSMLKKSYSCIPHISCITRITLIRHSFSFLYMLLSTLRITLFLLHAFFIILLIFCYCKSVVNPLNL